MSDFKTIIEESFSQYSGSVIQSRALVDVRDCLKPSQRQIFYCMQSDGFTADKGFKKTLKAIGSAMRAYVHGDSSCEGIIMRSGQPFAMRYPLIEVEGSYGNLMESGNWAAARYTSSRLSSFSKYLFQDINKDTIDDWRDNYDDTEKYPSVLPSKGFYNIVNGTFGIGVGIASSIPQFNIIEVNNALIKLIENPDSSFDDIYCEPDFATGGIIINGDEIKESLKTGKGKACIIRAKIEYNKKENSLTVVEMPYNVYTNTICQQLEKIANSEDNPGIERINDFTGKEPCLRIYLSKGTNPDYIKEYLYQNTSLQSSFGINMVMLEDGRFPRIFSWKEALQEHLKHERIVYIRGFKYDLKKIEDRILIVEAIIKAIAKIEEVISTIKNSASSAEANKNLQILLNINETQAKAILDIKLAKLAKLEISKYEKELQELKEKRERIFAILNSETLLNIEIINGLKEVINKFGDKRKTSVMNLKIDKKKLNQKAIVPKDVVVMLSQEGYIKRISREAFKTQRRGGKGIKNKEAVPLTSISTNTIDTLLLFSSKGKMFKLSVNDIVAGTASSKGMNVRSFVNIDEDEKIIAMTSSCDTTNNKYIVFFTKKGLIKKTCLEEYTKLKNNPKKGIAAIKLRDGDSLANIAFLNDERVVVVTKNGMVIRFKTDDIRPIGRVTMGVQAIGLSEGDEVISGNIVYNKNDYLAIVYENGHGNKCYINEFPFYNRGAKGVSLSPKEKVAGVAIVNDTDDLLLIGNNNSLCISASELPNYSRRSLGNILMKDNIIKSIMKL